MNTAKEMSNFRIFSLIVLGISLGVFGMSLFNFGRLCARKWDAVIWVMRDHNEEIIYRDMSHFSTVQKIIITKK